MHRSINKIIKSIQCTCGITRLIESGKSKDSIRYSQSILLKLPRKLGYLMAILLTRQIIYLCDLIVHSSILNLSIYYSPILAYLFYIILKMKSKLKGIPIKFAFAVSRSILKASIPSPLYFFLLVMCFLQTSLIFINTQSLAFSIMKWLDPSIYLDPKITILILTIPNMLTGITIVSQVIWAGKEQKIQTSIFKHYIIKISTVSGLVLGYALCLPMIRCSVLNLSSTFIEFRIIAMVNLIIFLFVNYFYSIFLLLDLSPHNGKVYAFVSFPNCYTILNVYRPIAAFIAVTNNINYTIVPAVILFIILVIWMIKYPLITWRYNTVSQIFICSILWTILCKIFSLISQQQVLFISYIFGLPIFSIFFLWILRKRIVYVLKKDKTSVLQLKILYHLLVNFEQSKQQLDIFIIQHYCKCTINGCSCQKIIEHLSKQKSSNQSIENKQKMLKTKVMKKTKRTSKQFQYKQSEIEDELTRTQSKHLQLKQKQKQYWYQLLYFLQNQQFLFDKVKELSPTDKETQIKKSSSIIFDQIQVFHYFLDKQYQSLRNLWYFSHYLKDKMFPPFFLLVRFTIQLYKQDQTIQKKSKQEGSNKYALNFCELQTKLLNFRQLLLKSSIKIQYFWSELSRPKPDQKKIIQSIQQILKSRQNIQAQLKLYEGFEHENKNNLKEQEQIQKKKIKIAIQNIYNTYELAVNMKYLIKISETRPDKFEKQAKKLEKNLLFYDSQSKTGMGVVNVQEGQQFGLISLTNKYFWELLNYQRFQKPKINHFLVKEMHNYHDRTIVNYLRQNKHFLTFSSGFVLDGNKLLVELQFSAQLLPHIYNGLFAAAFFQQAKSERSIFLTDKISNILAYNKNFKQKFLVSINVRQFDEIINKQVIVKLEMDKKCVISLNDVDYLVKNIHQIIGQNQQQDLFFCEIHEQWDTIPMKSKAIEQQQKSQFYNREEEIRQISKSKSKKQQIGELKKLKKQNLQYLFSIVRNTKVSSKIKKWSIFIIVTLILCVILTTICTGLTELRVQGYHSANKQFNSNSRLIQHITESAYTIRRINNLNFNNLTGSIPAYYSKLKNLKQKILDQRVGTNLGLWPILYPSYQITKTDKILLSNTNFQMILQKYLLAAYTTFINNINSMNFDYIKSKVALPYDTLYLNFLGVLYNSYYVVLPQIVNQFTNAPVLNWYNILIKSFVVVPMTFSIALCQLFTIGITIILRRRILKTLQTTIKLIQHLKLSSIDLRLKQIKQYTKINLADLWEGQRLKQRERKRQCDCQNGITDHFSEDDQITNLRKLTAINKAEFTVDNMNSTVRDLTQTPRENREKQRKLTANIKDNGRFKMQRLSQSKIILILIFGLLPVISIQCTVAITQTLYNEYFWDTLTLKRLYNEKIENIRYIKSFSYEIGYETGNFKSTNISIISQFRHSLEKIYVIERSIQQFHNNKSNSFIDQVHRINQLNFCQILDSFYEDQNSVTCITDLRKKYEKKYRSQILVQYIETARGLVEEYEDLNLTFDHQRAFAQDPRHEYLEQTALYLIEIQNELVKKFEVYYTEAVKVYQITLICLALSALGILIFVKIIWSKYQLKQMKFEVEQIKLIIQLISQQEVNNNSELKKQILDIQDIFDILI